MFSSLEVLRQKKMHDNTCLGYMLLDLNTVIIFVVQIIMQCLHTPFTYAPLSSTVLLIILFSPSVVLLGILFSRWFLSILFLRTLFSSAYCSYFRSSAYCSYVRCFPQYTFLTFICSQRSLLTFSSPHHTVLAFICSPRHIILTFSSQHTVLTYAVLLSILFSRLVLSVLSIRTLFSIYCSHVHLFSAFCSHFQFSSSYSSHVKFSSTYCFYLQLFSPGYCFHVQLFSSSYCSRVQLFSSAYSSHVQFS